MPRRTFLKTVVFASAATALHGLVQAKTDQPIAIIGAGAAGLSAAYRLGQQGIKTVIFEADKRVGGRIHTLDGLIPAASNEGTAMFCELGGELVDSNHESLINLAQELGVKIQELKDGDPGVEFYHFGGKTFTNKELIPLFGPLAEQLGRDSENLETEAGEYTEKARQLDRISISEYLARFEGKVEPWVLQLLNTAYEIEYGRSTKEQSSLNLITYLSADTSNGFEMFGDSDESKRVQGGSSRLIEALLKALESTKASETRQEHKLVALAQDTKPGILLSFDTPKGYQQIRFQKVICALPFSVMRSGRVAGLKDLGLSAGKFRAIEELGYGNNTKAMIAFKSRLWRKATPENNGSTYSGQSFQCVWETSRGQEGPCGILTNFLGGTAAVEATPGTRFDQTLRELENIYPGIEKEYLGKRVMNHWPSAKGVRGSYTCPLVGQVTTLLEHCATPELNGSLLFAGEHTSADFSGFMNGAIESGERAAKEALNG